jgi:hypothetical protein
LVLTAACDSVPADPIVGEPTIVGEITTLDSSGVQLRILVEERPEVQQGEKIWFSIGGTDVFDARGPTVIRASRQSLRVGLEVEGLADGPILESYPAQAHAQTIVILD